MKKETEKLTEFIYLGEKVNTFGDIFQIFRDKDNKIISFTGIKGLWIGSVYGINVAAGTMKSRPARIDDSTLERTESEKKEFEAHKEIVKNRRLEKRKRLELKKPHADIVRAIELLKPFASTLDLMDLRRFGDYITNQISKKKRK